LTRICSLCGACKNPNIKVARFDPKELFPMIRLLMLVLAVSCLVSAQMPPLIDRQILFDDPEISGAQLSPDGKYVTFFRPYNKISNVWLKKAAEPFSAAVPITQETARPIASHFWTRDSKFVLFIKDNGGDENFNIFAVNPADAKAGTVPTTRGLTEKKGARILIYKVPKHDPDLLLIGINNRDKAWHDLYRLKISTGELTLIRENKEKIAGWIFDEAGVLRLAQRSTDNGGSEILRVEANGFQPIYSCTAEESCGILRFHKDGKRAYLTTNRSEALDKNQLELLDVATGKTEFVEKDLNGRVDFGGAAFSEVTGELIYTNYVDDRTQFRFTDKKWEADYRLLQSKLSGRQIFFAGCTSDETKCLVAANGDTEPGETYLFDRQTKQLTLQYRLRENLDRSSLSAMESIRYKSSDGLEIPAYLTMPKGAKRPVPLIVLPHGGPWARDTWGFRGMVQMLANRGYAVLQPNFRASTGYGKKFLNLGNGQWGQTMQDDLTYGVKHLVAQGLVDPKRVGIMGGSYGGYATLAGVTFTPDVYQAAVAIVAPSNLITLLDSIPPYWESIRKTFYVRMGDPGTEAGKALLMRQSPVNSADKIKTPLMVVQGANDPRVNKAESDQIVVALRDRKFPVEYLVAPDEGHGFARPVNNMAMMFASEKFLAKHLGGRFQEDATAEVSTRLKEITVDPATVTLAKKATAAVGLPAGLMPVGMDQRTYEIKMSIGGQELSMRSVNSVLEKEGALMIADAVSTPMGDASDLVTVDKKSLEVRARAVNQGPVKLDWLLAEGKLTGKMSMNGTERPINVELGGPVFGDGAALMRTLPALPLKEGYSTTFRNINQQNMKPKLLQVKVVKVTKVKVLAGEFEAYELELSSAEGGSDKATYWVSVTDPKVVKSEAVVAEMGGAKVLVELAK
jgi:dipeptidyl aminopeptidase/acylaminoacyl peptidase